MRFSDFKYKLSEAAINPKTFAPSATNKGRNSNYYRNLINLIRDGVPIAIHGKQKAVIIDAQVADELEAIWNPTGQDKSEQATAKQVAKMLAVNFKADDGNVYKINNIEKSKDIKQLTSDEGEEAFTKWWNKGNVAEGIMACAVITKFNLKGAEITSAQVLETVASVETVVVPPDPNAKVKRETRKGVLTSDAFGKQLSLTISLSRNDFAAVLMSAQDRGTFEKYDQADEVYKLYEDCAYYVNQSDNVVGAIEKIKNAAPEDQVTVTADGATAEAQHSTKADLWIAVGGTKERLLSIKTSTVKHIGAVSGYEFDHLSKYFESTLGFGLPEEMRESFMKPPAGKFLPNEDGEMIVPNPEYIKMSREERSSAVRNAMTQNFRGPIKEAYTWVFQQIQDRLAGNSDDAEYDFVKTVAGGVIHHATLGEDVRLVIISPSAKKAYTELKIGDNLYESLAEYDLVPHLDIQSNYRILIYGYPVGDTAERVHSDKSMFVQLRSYVQDGAARNVVEIGGLLKNLTDITKVKSKDAEHEPTEKPTTPASVPTTKTTANKTDLPATNQAPLQQNPNVTTLQGTEWVPQTTDDEEEAVREVSAEPQSKDINRIRHLAGIVSHMSKNI